MKFTAYIYITYISCICWACSSNENAPVDRPGTANKTDQEFLSNAAMRIEGDPLTLRYNDGGIVFMEDAEGTVSGVRVDDGVNFQFNPHASTLSVNGSPIHISGAELLKESNGTRWYKLTRSTTTDVIYLVVDL